MVIDGIHDYDYMGGLMASGDFNGDGFGDLITHAGDQYYGERICIYLGGNPPDSTLDWEISFPSGAPTIMGLNAGFDPNNDGYDDFSFERSARDSSFFFFLGGDTLSHNPRLVGNPYNFLKFDMSGDSIDDFLGPGPISGSYLYLGGNPLDLEPDYRLGFIGAWPFIYHRAGHADILLGDDTRVWNIHRFIMSNLGIPPDTIPIGYIYYDSSRFVASPDIGDINADGNGELALGNNRNNPNPRIDIYTITTTGIDENGENNIMPEEPSISAYPNPFNSSTIISINGIDKAEIHIYDIAGRSISLLHATNGKAIWDASSLPSGLYFALVEAGKFTKRIKLILLK